MSGAESDYYERLDPPVHCVNGPLTTLDELYLVKGVSENFLQWKEGEDLGSPAVTPRLTQLFTVHGMSDTQGEDGRFSFPGRININTAGVEILSFMLPAGMEDQASELVELQAGTGFGRPGICKCP